ncbi:UNC-like C-terminal-domain-containing protein, partial [Pterulicium gracile]
MAFLASRRFFIFSGILFAGCRASTEVTSTSVSTTTTTTMSGIEVDLGTGTNASRTTGIVLLASPSPSASSTVMVPPPPPPHSPQPFTTNNVFRIIQLLTPPPPSPPICCLRPLPGSRKEDDDDALLLSFEDWKVRQGGGSSPQGSGHGNGRRHVSSSAVGGGSGNGNRSVTGQKDSREKDKDDSESDHAETKDAAHSPPASSPAPSSPSSPTDSNASSSTPDETNDKVNGNGGVMGVSSSQAHQQIPTQPHLLIDRFNYASLDCSARVHSAHKGAKSASAILSSKRDRYMLSPCGTSNANAHGIGMNGNEKGHFVVVELCDDIRIDTVQLANFEFFSGVFKDVTISAAKTHPVGKEGWTGAGVYRAKNVRGVQSFHTPTLRDFYRYIRIDFHSHYGNEYYCPVSLLRVFGLTHLEQWKLDQVQDAEEEQHERESKEQLDELPTVVEVVRIAKEEEVIVVPPVVLGDVPAKKGGPDIQPIPASPLEAHHDSESSAPPPPPSITHDSTTPSSPASEASINVADSQSSAAATVIVTASPSQDSPHPPPHSSHSSPQAHQNPPPSSPSSSSLSHTRPQPYAAAGESIYRVIMTRLSALEHNATLYARYAEEHSLSIHRILQRYGEELGRVEGLGRGVGRE